MFNTPRAMIVLPSLLACVAGGCPTPEPLADTHVAELRVLSAEDGAFTAEPGDALTITVQALTSADDGVNGIPVELLTPRDDHLHVLEPGVDEAGVARATTATTTVDGVRLPGAARFVVSFDPALRAGTWTLWVSAATRDEPDQDASTGDADDMHPWSATQVVTPIVIEIVDADEGATTSDDASAAT